MCSIDRSKIIVCRRARENGNTIVGRPMFEKFSRLRERYHVASLIILSPIFFRGFANRRAGLAAAYIAIKKERVVGNERKDKESYIANRLR